MASASTLCPTAAHCYGVAKVLGVDYLGAKARIPREFMSMGTVGAGDRHVNSEFWFSLDSVSYLEAGLRVGNNTGSVDGGCDCDEYNLFWSEISPMNVEYRHIIMKATPTVGVSDLYEFVRKPNSPNQWLVNLNGVTIGQSSTTVKWTGNRMDLGGEYSNNTCSASGGSANSSNLQSWLMNSTSAWYRPSWSTFEVDRHCGMAGSFRGSAGTFTWGRPSASSLLATADAESFSAVPMSLAAPKTDESLPDVSPEEARRERVANFLPAQPYDSAAPFVGAAAVTNAALRLASHPDGSALSDAEKAATQTRAVLTSYASISERDPALGGDPDISSDRPVWAVTVYAPVSNQGALPGTEPRRWGVYSVIYDAPTGELIVSATGLDLS